MNTLHQWKPFKNVEELQHRLMHLMGNINGRYNHPLDGNDDWQPLVDIIEAENEYLIKVELPEVRKEDLQVTVKQGVLMISGERHPEPEQYGSKFYRMERPFGSFTRSFSLPEGADPANIRAEFKDGVLRVQVAKSERSGPQTIPIENG